MNLPSGEMMLNIYIALAIAGAIGVGIWSGFLARRKIQPGSFKWKRFGWESVAMLVTVTVSASLLVWVRGWFDTMGWISFGSGPAVWYIVAFEYFAYWLAFDTWFYWNHRLMHQEPIYTWVHKLHHMSPAPNVMTTFSVNPLESIINGIFLTLFVAVFTIHDLTMALLVPTTVLMGLHVHCGYEFLPRWWNKTWATKWFITATFHDQHHKYFRYNFGGFTPIWDYLCGTVRKNYEADFLKIHDRAKAGRKVQAEAEPAE